MQKTDKILLVTVLCAGFIPFGYSVKQPVYAYKTASTDRKEPWTVMIVDAETGKIISESAFKSNSSGISTKKLYFDFDRYPREKVGVLNAGILQIDDKDREKARALQKKIAARDVAGVKDGKRYYAFKNGLYYEDDVKQVLADMEWLDKQRQGTIQNTLQNGFEATKDIAPPGTKIEIYADAEKMYVDFKKPGAVRSARKNAEQGVRKRVDTISDKVGQQVGKIKELLNASSL